MNIPQAFRPLIQGLIEATMNRRVAWTEGPARDTFSASLNTFTINVAAKPPNSQVPFQPGIPLHFRAIDVEGKVIDEFTVSVHDGADYTVISTLFDHARRSARKIDEKVNQMLRELQ